MRGGGSDSRRLRLLGVPRGEGGAPEGDNFSRGDRKRLLRLSTAPPAPSWRARRLAPVEQTKKLGPGELRVSQGQTARTGKEAELLPTENSGL